MRAAKASALKGQSPLKRAAAQPQRGFVDLARRLQPRAMPLAELLWI